MSYGFYKQVGIWLAWNAAVAAVMFGVIAWLAADMNARVASIRDARTAIKAREVVRENVTVLRSQASLAAQEVPYLMSLLPTEDALIDFPREAGVLARQNALDFSFSFKESVKGSTTTPGSVAFSASGKGGGEGWLAFLRSFSAGSKIIGFDDIRMTSKDGSVYDTVIHGKIFTQ